LSPVADIVFEPTSTGAMVITNKSNNPLFKKDCKILEPPSTMTRLIEKGGECNIDNKCVRESCPEIYLRMSN